MAGGTASVDRAEAEQVLDGLVLRKAIRFDVPVGTLFALLTSEEAAGQWMAADVELDPVVGGAVVVAAMGWPVVSGQVEVMRQSEALTVRWQADEWPGPLRTSITTGAEDGGTRLELTETGYGGDDDLLRRRDWLWSHWLVRLAATAARQRFMS